MRSELSKNDLYESVKTLVETEDKHLHLCQHKLYTLFSIAFQYMLFRSTKEPGAYIIRVEDSILVDKLSKKSKDPSTRKFMHSLIIPRKLKYQKSMFYLDTFLPGTWNLTKDLDPNRIKGAIVVKNTNDKTKVEFQEINEEEEEQQIPLPEGYYYYSLQEFVPKTLVIGYECDYENTTPIKFPFIKKEKERTVSGVKIADNLDWDKFD